MSSHDHYQSAHDRGARRGALGPAWDPKPTVQLKPKRTQVSMPRAQRPLYIAEGSGFWPEDSAGWSLCRWLFALNVTLYGSLAFSIWTR